MQSSILEESSLKTTLHPLCLHEVPFSIFASTGSGSSICFSIAFGGFGTFTPTLVLLALEL